MENKSKKNNSRIFHKPTYGTGLSGKIGKIVKIVGIVIFIFIVCVSFVAWTNTLSVNVMEMPINSTDKINQ